MSKINTVAFQQHEKQWNELPYPKLPKYSFGGSGCGAFSVLHTARQKPKYWTLKPEDVYPVMLPYATEGHGTTWAGIAHGLTTYGYNMIKTPDVKKSMKPAWDALNENSVGVILFGNEPAGKDGLIWAGNAHYVSIAAYKKVKGKHWFYTIDSSRGHTGWFEYKQHMKGAIHKIWICYRKPTNYKVKADGYWGCATTIALQHYFSVKENGIIANQPPTTKSIHKPYGMDTTFRYKKDEDGSAVIRELDKFLNKKLHKSLPVDGILGSSSIRALQKFLGVKETGVLNKKTVKKLQQFLNKSVDK